MPILATTPRTVNQITTGQQWNGEPTRMPDGRIFVTWETYDGATARLYGRFLAADGTPTGSDILIYTDAVDAYRTQQNFSVALSNGRILVTWQDSDSLRDYPELRGQFLNANGTLSGSQFIVGDSAPGVRFGADPEPLALSNGGFAIAAVHTELNPGLPPGDLYVRVYIYNESGQRTATAQLPSAAGVVKEEPDIAQLADGRILVTWSEGDVSPGGGSYFPSRVKAAIFNTDGTVSVGEWLVGSTPLEFGSTRNRNDCAALTGGNFVVMVDGFATIYNAAGGVVAPKFQIVSLDVAGETDIQLVALTDGRFAVTWEWYIGGSNPNVIYTTVYNANGTVTEPTAIIVSSADSFSDVTTAALVGGKYMVTWTESVAFGDYDVFSTIVSTGISRNPSPGPDILTGTAANNAINGLGGDDTISGLAGNDALVGGAGNDTLNGGDGNDYLNGGAGADALIGGAGADYAQYGNATAGITVRLDLPNLNTGEAAGDTYSGIEGVIGGAFGDTIFGNAGVNYLFGQGGNDYADGLGGNDFVYGGDGNDNLSGGIGADRLDGGAGFDYARYVNAAAALVIRLDAPSLNTGEAAGDTYIGIEGLIGGAFGDTIVGNAAINYLWGLDGNDYIDGLAGNDALYGGDGNDNLSGGLGSDKLDGGAGFDLARYGLATAALVIRLDVPSLNTGEAKGDTYVDIEGIVGGAFGDTIVGNAEVNYLWGLAGNDYIDGLGGNDALYGGDGNDNLVGGSGADKLDGGNGYDFARYDAATAGVNARLDNASLNTGFAAGDAYVSIEGLAGSAFGDVLVGDTGNNAIFGLAGNDALYGGLGNDSLNGGEGGDTLVGGAGNDALAGGLGDDTYYIDAEGDVAAEASGAGYDTVSTTLLAYTLGANLERVNYAGTGNFVGSGNALANRFQGGAGNDRFIDILGGADIFSGGNGNDTVDFRGSATGAVLNFVTNVHGGAAAGDSYSGIEKFLGSSTAADAMTMGGTGRALFVGGGGNDTLTGGVKNDQLIGEAGNDTLVGGADRDSLDGGTGNDTIAGGAAGDVFVFTDAAFGQDTITGFEDDLDSFKVFSSVADSISDFTIIGNGTASVTLTLNSAPANTITINGAAPITIAADDFVFY